MRHESVTVKMTNPEENMQDLINLFSWMGFTAGFSCEQLVATAKHIIEEQYLQSIIISPVSTPKP